MNNIQTYVKIAIEMNDLLKKDLVSPQTPERITVTFDSLINAISTLERLAAQKPERNRIRVRNI